MHSFEVESSIFYVNISTNYNTCQYNKMKLLTLFLLVAMTLAFEISASSQVSKNLKLVDGKGSSITDETQAMIKSIIELAYIFNSNNHTQNAKQISQKLKRKIPGNWNTYIFDYSNTTNVYMTGGIFPSQSNTWWYISSQENFYVKWTYIIFKQTSSVIKSTNMFTNSTQYKGSGVDDAMQTKLNNLLVYSNRYVDIQQRVQFLSLKLTEEMDGQWMVIVHIGSNSLFPYYGGSIFVIDDLWYRFSSSTGSTYWKILIAKIKKN